jgi:hypothetical protein
MQLTAITSNAGSPQQKPGFAQRTPAHAELPVNQKTYRKQAAQPLISGFWHENGTPEKMTIRSQVFESSVKLTFPIFFP